MYRWVWYQSEIEVMRIGWFSKNCILLEHKFPNFPLDMAMLGRSQVPTEISTTAIDLFFFTNTVGRILSTLATCKLQISSIDQLVRLNVLECFAHAKLTARYHSCLNVPLWHPVLHFRWLHLSQCAVIFNTAPITIWHVHTPENLLATRWSILAKCWLVSH